MKNLLYIITHTLQNQEEEFSTYIKKSLEQENYHSSLVFIQGDIAQEVRSCKNKYILQDDDNFSDVQSSIAPISYRDLLGLIFLSDSVVVM